MTFGVYDPGPFRMILSGLHEAEFEVTKKPDDWESKEYGVKKAFEIVVPPGRHALRIQCITPPGFIHTDYRKLCYFIKDFRKAPAP